MAMIIEPVVTMRTLASGKSAAKANEAIPPKIVSIPTMIESIAIIVTESGLAVGCVKIFLSIIHKKYSNKWFLDNLSVEHVIIPERLNNSVPSVG